MERGAIVVDTRMPHSFGGAHIRDTYSIWLGGVPSFAGWLLSYDRPILLVLEEKEQLETAVRYLIRLGYDNITGFLNGGIPAWYIRALQTDSLNLISVHDLKGKLERGDEMIILDVRSKREWNKGHIDGARHIYVGHLEKHLDEISKYSPVIVYCGTSRRSNIAASILKKNGFNRVYNVLGSMAAWKNAGYNLTK